MCLYKVECYCSTLFFVKEYFMSNKLKNSKFVSIKSRVLYEVAEDAAILSAESNNAT